MSRKLLAVMLVLLLAMMVVPTAFAQGDDPPDEDADDDEPFDCESGPTHPGVLRVAGMLYDKPSDEVSDSEYLEVCTLWQEEGVGLGNIAKAIRLAGVLEGSGLDWEALLQRHQEGTGWGNIMQASRLAADPGDVETLLAAREQCGWGQIRKGDCEGYEDLEIGHPGRGQGHGNQPCEGGPPCGNSNGNRGNANPPGLSNRGGRGNNTDDADDDNPT